MRTDAQFDAALEALRQSEAHIETPPRVAVAVLAAWDAMHASDTRDTKRHPPGAVRARPMKDTRSVRKVGAIAAAVISVVSLGILGHQLQRSMETQTPDRGTRTVVLVGEPILQGEPARLVRMRLPASTLAALGIVSTTADSSAPIEVDVIIGEDGVARAIQVGM